VKNWLAKNTFFLFLAGLAGLYIVSVLCNLGYLSLRVEEPRRVIVALEMLQSGDYLQPHTLGWNYYNKPPVFAWILAGFINLFGSASEFVTRLPSFVSLLVFAACHYWVAQKYLTKQAAALSAFFMLTSADLYFYTLSNGAEIDIFYGFVVYLQTVSMFYFYEKRKYTLLFVVSWSLCAVGFLTKGFTSPVFQGLTLIALCIYARSVKLIFKWQHLAGILAFLVLTGFFFYAYNRDQSAKILLINLAKEAIFKSAVGRESSGKLHEVLTYPIVLLRVLAPWCFILLVLFKKGKYKILDNPFVRFSVLFILLNIGVYWITAAQKTRYIIMFIPFVTSIISFVYWQYEKQHPGKFNQYLKYAGLLFALVVAALLVLPFVTNIDWWRALAFAIVLTGFLFLFYRTSQSRIWLFIAGVVLIRLIYGVIGISEKGKREFDYEGMIKAMAAKNNNQEVYYWAKPDTLDLNITIAGKIYKWENEPVKVLPGISYPVPYYFYRATGKLVKFDTVLQHDKTYISNQPHLKNITIEPIDSFYDRMQDNYLIMFKAKK
jgi:4-amino-4-deoxy-L-arabinose transferase-like glycosyltransferase